MLLDKPGGFKQFRLAIFGGFVLGSERSRLYNELYFLFLEITDEFELIEDCLDKCCVCSDKAAASNNVDIDE